MLAALAPEYFYATIVDTSPTLRSVTANMHAHVSVSATIVTKMSFVKTLFTIPATPINFCCCCQDYPTWHLAQFAVPSAELLALLRRSRACCYCHSPTTPVVTTARPTEAPPPNPWRLLLPLASDTTLSLSSLLLVVLLSSTITAAATA